MSSILQTRLPFAQGETVSSDVFNRMIRVLELNLSAVDINISPHFNATEISELQFATGAIIFNTTNGIHQALMVHSSATCTVIRATRPANKLQAQ
jgi:hypothetical protein